MWVGWSGQDGCGVVRGGLNGRDRTGAAPKWMVGAGRGGVGRAERRELAWDGPSVRAGPAWHG